MAGKGTKTKTTDGRGKTRPATKSRTRSKK